MADPRERETAERFVEGSREVRKGIEIVVSQGQPADWTPPSASLGPEPTGSVSDGAGGSAESD